MLDEVAGRGARGRTRRRARGPERDRPGSRGPRLPERRDGAAGAAERLPFGGHLVDEGDAVLRAWGWAWRERRRRRSPDRSHRPSARCGRSRGQPAIALVGDSVPPMDIDEFYEADPRRRASAELELGSEWLDEDGVRHELNYVEDTGRALRPARAGAPRDRGPLRRPPRHGPARVRQQDDRARHRQDRLGGRAAPDPRGLAGGHAGRRRRRVAGRASAGGRRRGGPGGTIPSPTTDDGPIADRAIGRASA